MVTLKKIDYEKIGYYGKPITDLTRNELMKAFEEFSAEIDALLSAENVVVYREPISSEELKIFASNLPQYQFLAIAGGCCNCGNNCFRDGHRQV